MERTNNENAHEKRNSVKRPRKVSETETANNVDAASMFKRAIKRKAKINPVQSQGGQQ